MSELNQKLKQYKAMKAELQPMIDALTTLEKDIKKHVMETGELGDVDGSERCH